MASTTDRVNTFLKSLFKGIGLFRNLSCNFRRPAACREWGMWQTIVPAIVNTRYKSGCIGLSNHNRLRFIPKEPINLNFPSSLMSTWSCWFQLSTVITPWSPSGTPAISPVQRIITRFLSGDTLIRRVLWMVAILSNVDNILFHICSACFLSRSPSE